VRLSIWGREYLPQGTHYQETTRNQIEVRIGFIIYPVISPCRKSPPEHGKTALSGKTFGLSILPSAHLVIADGNTAINPR
jgi:hypothetical protein